MSSIRVKRRVRMLLAARENAGVAAIEFAFLSFILLMILAGTVDIARLLYTTMELDNALNAGAQYALANASMVGSNPSGLDSNITNIVTNLNGIGWATSTVNVNNNNDATHCYCPGGSPGNWTWGSSVSCGSSCSGGGIGGQFVTIAVSRSITPIFSSFGFVTNGQITRGALVETQ